MLRYSFYAKLNKILIILQTSCKSIYGFNVLTGFALRYFKNLKITLELVTINIM